LGEAGALPFIASFVIATALLHGIGVAVGLGSARFGGAVVTRLAGGLTALGGLWLFAGM
jgi:urease accessory protein